MTSRPIRRAARFLPSPPCAPALAAGVIAAFALALAGCGGDDAPATPASDAATPPDDGGVANVVVSHPAAVPIAPATECTVVTYEAAAPHGVHVPECSSVVYDHVPPMYGDHYPAWADFKRYDAPVPWGYLVHSLEHGAVVLVDGCGDASACAEVRAALDRVLAELPEPADPLCSGSPRGRVIVVPDPTLDVPIAAVSWGHTYRATCLDEPSLRAFVASAYRSGPEDLCAAGIDLSPAGWCASR